ncbi:MAG TPA: TonB-dependent receptor, partial [Longimicrobiaceae bacterium]|nr:TonB-dependent receptor [Longimicrobiaceae bacterium]
MLIAVAAAMIAAAAPADTAPATLRGAVQAEPGGAVLAHAVVEVQAGGQTLTATTDSTGSYVLRQVPAGFRVVRVRSLDHEPQEVRVLLPPGAQVVLDVSLKPRPVVLDTLVAVQNPHGGGVGDTAQAGSGAVAIVSSRLINEAPGAVSAVSGAAGVGSGGEPGDPRDVLWVRGSAADLKLVLLDGAPVYTPFHMGGLVQTFEPEVLGSARLYLGGAPARYDGGLAYVMEMDTRSGRGGHPHTSGSADLVSARLLAEGGVAGGATYLASVRGVNGRAVQALGGAPFPYTYSEGLARVDVPSGARSGFSLTGFANGEGVRVDTVPASHEFARWGNAAGSVRWRGPVTRGTGLEATAAYSRFYARLPWSTEVRDVLMGGDARRLRLAADLSHGSGTVRTRYGVSYDRA